MLLIHNICGQNTNFFYVEKVGCDNIPPGKWLEKPASGAYNNDQTENP